MLPMLHIGSGRAALANKVYLLLHTIKLEVVISFAKECLGHKCAMSRTHTHSVWGFSKVGASVQKIAKYAGRLLGWVSDWGVEARVLSRED